MRRDYEVARSVAPSLIPHSRANSGRRYWLIRWFRCLDRYHVLTHHFNSASEGTHQNSCNSNDVRFAANERVLPPKNKCHTRQRFRNRREPERGNLSNQSRRGLPR
jgi:hypothetical protein